MIPLWSNSNNGRRASRPRKPALRASRRGVVPRCRRQVSRATVCVPAQPHERNAQICRSTVRPNDDGRCARRAAERGRKPSDRRPNQCANQQQGKQRALAGPRQSSSPSAARWRMKWNGLSRHTLCRSRSDHLQITVPTTTSCDCSSDRFVRFGSRRSASGPRHRSLEARRSACTTATHLQ